MLLANYSVNNESQIQEGANMKADMRTRSNDKCELATDVILKGLSYVNSGFILSPCDIRDMLGIKPTYHAWHQHRKVGMLIRMLSRHDLQVTVSPASGLTVTQVKATRNTYQPITAWVH